MRSPVTQYYGLKWNPFLPEAPVSAFTQLPRHEQFFWRVESLASEGGFALVLGDPGTGKSITMRLLEERLARGQRVQVAALTRPQSALGDFYREIGTLFSVPLSASNRWGGYRALREKWLAHCDQARTRPVLLVDEAQEMPSPVLSELRLLSSVEFDARSVLTVVLAGDGRLRDKLRQPDLAPLESRIRVRLRLETAAKDDQETLLRHALDSAGNARLMTDDLIHAVADHSQGNVRALMNLGGELLQMGMRRERATLDVDLLLEMLGDREPKPGSRGRTAR